MGDPVTVEVKIMTDAGVVLYWDRAATFCAGVEDAVRKGHTMAGANLRKQDLAGGNFTAGNFTGAHFEGANCIGSNFTNAILSSADFSGAAVTEATWAGATVTAADLDALANDALASTSAPATVTPTANAIPKGNAAGYLPEGWRRCPSTPVNTSAAPYVVLVTDESIDVTTAAGANDVDLPTAVGCTGRTISVKKVDAGAGTAPIDPNGAEVIENLGAGNPYILTAQYQGVTLRSDGAKWNVVTSTTTTAAHAGTHTNAGADPVRLTVRTPAAGACVIATTDHYVRAASLGAGAVAATLYVADAAAVGRVVTVVKVDAAADDVNVTPAGAETINGVAAFYALAAQWNSVTLLCVAVGQWEIVAAR